MKEQKIQLDIRRVRIANIDVQNTFMHWQGPFGPGTTAIIRVWETSIKPLVERARGEGVEIAWMQAIYKEGEYMPFRLLAVQGDATVTIINPVTGKEDSNWQISIWEGANLPGERVFQKSSPATFDWRGQDNGFNEWLGPKDKSQSVIITGFTASTCVDRAICEVLDTGRTVIVPADSVGVRDKRLDDLPKFLEQWGRAGAIIIPTQGDIEFVNATRSR